MASNFITRTEGNFDFVPGSGTYCSDVVPHAGFAVAHAIFVEPQPLARGFEHVRDHLARLGRPMSALCGAELRIAEPLSFDGFAAFNAVYVALLDSYALRVPALDSGAPLGTMTRTNVSPDTPLAKPQEPSIFAFSYTIPGQRPNGRKSFVSSGAGELPGSTRESIVRLGETSPDALREKARWVMNSIIGRLPGLGVSVSDITQLNLYCVHPPESYLQSEMLAPLAQHAGIGVHWYFSRPPILEIEFEADVKGVIQENYL